MALRVPPEKQLEMASYLAKLITKNNPKYLDLFTKIFYELISSGEIASDKIRELCKESGINIYSVSKKLTGLKNLEVIYPELKGLPKKGGRWVWRFHPEFIKIVKYLSRVL